MKTNNSTKYTIAVVVAALVFEAAVVLSPKGLPGLVDSSINLFNRSAQGIKKTIAFVAPDVAVLIRAVGARKAFTGLLEDSGLALQEMVQDKGAGCFVRPVDGPATAAASCDRQAAP